MKFSTINQELWEVGRAAGNFLLRIAGPPPTPSQGGEWIQESANH